MLSHGVELDRQKPIGAAHDDAIKKTPVTVDVPSVIDVVPTTRPPVRA